MSHGLPYNWEPLGVQVSCRVSEARAVGTLVPWAHRVYRVTEHREQDVLAGRVPDAYLGPDAFGRWLDDLVAMAAPITKTLLDPVVPVEHDSQDGDAVRLTVVMPRGVFEGLRDVALWLGEEG